MMNTLTLSKFSLNTLTVILACLWIGGCTRSTDNLGEIEIKLPPHPSISEKSTNYFVQRTLPTFCYILNVTGSGISSEVPNCRPSLGTHTSFLEPLSTATVEVEKGSDRSIELFGYIARTGETCASIQGDFKDVPLNRLYRLAGVKGVNIDRETVTVTLTVAFPGVPTHLGLQDSMESSCYSSLPAVEIGSDLVLMPSVLKSSRFTLQPNQVQFSLAPSAASSHFKMTGEVSHAR